MCFYIFENLGNTCFFNTSLQALFSSQIFCETILNINLVTLENAKSRVQEKYKNDCWRRERRLKEISFFEAFVEATDLYHRTAKTKKVRFYFYLIMRRESD